MKMTFAEKVEKKLGELSAALKSAGFVSYHGRSGTIWKGLAPGTSSAEEEALPLPFIRGG